MEALLCKKLGDPASASVRNESEPSSSPIKILGKYQEKPPLSFIPGSDYAGTVDAVGSAVTKFKVGDHGCSFPVLGSFASFIVQDQSLLFGLPKRCDLVAAVVLLVAFGTSHIALVHKASLSSSQVLLVLGAAGGVGFSAVQIGKVCGAVVIAAARPTLHSLH